MWTLTIVVALPFILTFILEASRQTPQTAKATEGDTLQPSKYKASGYDSPYRHYKDSYHNRGPIFSPDRRHIWDGEKWVRNEGGFGGGLVIGLLIAALIFYFFHV